jgi:hypothetical protein
MEKGQENKITANVLKDRLLTLWSHQDLNLGPTDYESVALTN